MPNKLKYPSAIKQGAFYCCPKCDYKTINRSGYSDHFLRKHISNFRFLCIDCSAGFKFLAQLNKHSKKCLGSEVSNRKRPGKPLSYLNARAVRDVLPGDLEEEIQTSNIIVDRLEGENSDIRQEMLIMDQRNRELEVENRMLLHKTRQLAEEKDKEISDLRLEIKRFEVQNRKLKDLNRKMEMKNKEHEKGNANEVIDEDYNRCESDDVQNHQSVSFLPPSSCVISRKKRKTGEKVRQEKEEEIIEALSSNSDFGKGLEVKEIMGKGRGVFTTKLFSRKEFICEYAGNLLKARDAKEIEMHYKKDSSKGSYMFFFEHRNSKFCIDATCESERFGRLINHSRRKPNCIIQKIVVNEIPRLIMIAKYDIGPGTELQFDYGDRNSKNIKDHPWLAR